MTRGAKHPGGGEALMADVQFSHDMGAYGRDVGADTPATANSLITMTNMAGALVSLALMAGVGVWGYDLMIRDVSGVPIVRAAKSDMRVLPKDPGGQLALHQGLAVNEIAAQGGASGPVDKVTLAPPAVALASEDQPVTTKAAVSVDGSAARPAPHAAEAFVLQGSDPQITTESSDELRQGAIDTVVAALMAEATPGAGVEDPNAAEASFDTPLIPQPAILFDAPGVSKSSRPRLRPEGGAVRAQPAAFTPAQQTQEIDPANIPAGTRLVQLGAFDSPEVARSEWERMQARFGVMLRGKSRVIQVAEYGGRTFYRLRAMGFVDLSDARRFCSAVKAEGVDCIPVQVK